MSQDSTLARKAVVSVDDKFDDTPTDEHKPVTGWDVSDQNPKFLAELIRALGRDMRDGFESIREEMRQERKAREALIDRVDELERIVPLRRKAIKK